MPLIQLGDLFSGETIGGSFTLTSVENVTFPTTIEDGNFGNVTFNSEADLPYVFTNGYFALFRPLNTTKGGLYNIEYCVSGCNGTTCTTTQVTMIEQPVVGSAFDINRCGVNGTYGSITACYTGGVFNNSDGLPYSGELAPITWVSLVTGLTIGTGSCITIPNTVPAGGISILFAPTTGPCDLAIVPATLVNKNIWAGNTFSRDLCLDKHQIEVYKNTPAGNTIALVKMDDTVNPTQGLFPISIPFPQPDNPGTAEIFPSGATKVWSFVSGPVTIPFTNTTTADFKNAVVGTYVFRKTITFGTCTSTADYTAVVKFCTLGDQVTKVKTACKLNTNITMNTAYAALFNSAYGIISSTGCWTYVDGTSQLDLEINGVPYVDYQTGDDFPYNAIVKITSVGVYEFEFGDIVGSGNNPGGCPDFTPEAVCGCDYFATYNEAGTFVIDTNSGAPCLGLGRTYAMGCGTREVSLYAKYNQLNAPPAIPSSGCSGAIASGGTWTLDFVSGSPGLPFTCKVNGVSTTFTTLGQTVGVGDPLVDLTGLPNPSNYVFKYTLTNTCGSNNKNLTVNIDCNECNKIPNTVAPRTNCVTTLSVRHPVSDVVNDVRITTPVNSFSVLYDHIFRMTDCDGGIVNYPYSGTYSKLEYQMIAPALVNGSYIKFLRLYYRTSSGTFGSTLLNLNPSTTPYLTGCAGTVTQADLLINFANTSIFTTALTKLIRNAICAAFSSGGGTTITQNYNLTVGMQSTSVKIRFLGKHSPTDQLICFGDSSNELIINKNGVDSTITTFTKTDSGPDISYDHTGGIPTFCDNFYYGINRSGLSGKGINIATSTFSNINILSSVDTVVVDTANPEYKPTLVCSKWNFATTMSPACVGAATYSYKVNNITIPENTATFTKITPLSEFNPFNPCTVPGTFEDFETTVTCDGCTYVKKTMTFSCPTI